MRFLPLLLSAILLLLGSVYLLLVGFETEPMSFLTRLTAKISFVSFLFVFLASPLFKLTKNGFTTFLKRNRKYFGLNFAAAHFIHLGVLLTLAWMTNGESMESRKGFVFWTGFFAYLTITAMVFTSFQKPKSWLTGQQWKSLHTFGIWLVGIIFLFSYGGRTALYLADFWPFGLAIVIALGIRTFTTFQK